jgi:hypothetical protein
MIRFHRVSDEETSRAIGVEKCLEGSDLSARFAGVPFHEGRDAEPGDSQSPAAEECRHAVVPAVNEDAKRPARQGP